MPAVELLYQAALELPPSRILVINAQPHHHLLALHKHASQLDLQQHFKPEYAAIQRMGLSVSPCLIASNHTHHNQYDVILLLPAKNKQQTYASMAEAMNKLESNGKLIVACANKYGAKSYASALKLLAGNLASRSKAKCRIFSACKSALFDHQLATQWMDTALPRRITSHGLIAQPGLFSWDHADPGSALLIQQLPQLTGSGMDLCSGYGLLSAHILQQSETITQLHLVEADHMALDCARQNTASWADSIQYHWADASRDTLPSGLDWIVCNPPFHTGQTRDVELGQTIVLRACQCLKRGGTLYLVANRQLPYEHVLRSALQPCHSRVEADGFKVITGVRSCIN